VPTSKRLSRRPSKEAPLDRDRMSISGRESEDNEDLKEIDDYVGI